MKRTVAIVLAIAVGLALGSPAVAQQDTLEMIKSTGVLVIGTRTGSPPFAYINKNNEWVGFSIDLVEMLVKPSVEKAVGILSGAYRDTSYPLPRFLWVNFTLTDTAMHEGGPHSEVAAAGVRDSDARLGDVLTAAERAGIFDDTAFVLVADHGMEETDPEVRGDWDLALRDAGLEFRDEGYGFLYLGESGTP